MLGRRLRNQGTRYDDIIVDTGAGDGIEMEASLTPADCASAPLQPSGVDVATMGLVDGRVAPTREHSPGVRAFALINRAPTNPRNLDESEVRNALSACIALEVAPSRVCDRVAFARALTAGQTVMNHRTVSRKLGTRLPRCMIWSSASRSRQEECDDMAMQVRQPEGSGRGSGQGMRDGSDEPRRYIGLRHEESFEQKIRLAADSKNMRVADYIREVI